MAKNTASKNVLGSLDLDSVDRDDDAEHICRQTYVSFIEGTLIGDATESVLLFVPQTDITVTAVRVVPSNAITKGATLPIVSLDQGDLAAGTLTAISTIVDLAATSLAARTAVSGTVSAGGVTKNVGVYATFTKQSTGAVVGDTRLTILVDYDLAN